MKVYGSAPNLTLFENYVLAVLENARLDYQTALPFVEVFLGEVFRQDAQEADFGQIYLPDLDQYRQKSSAQGGVWLVDNFFPRLGEIVRDYYLPADSPLWEEWIRNWSQESFVQVFVAALLGEERMEMGQAGIKFDYHYWRCWLYSLWGQTYEWGRFTVNDRMGEAMGQLYQFPEPPSMEKGEFLLQARYLLEAHGFKVVVHPDGKTVEYYR